MINRWLALLFGLPLLAWSGTVSAGELVLFDEANPPYMYSADGKVAGVYPALLAEVFKRAGIEVELQAGPWKRDLAGLDAGTNGVGGIYQNSERLLKYDYSDKLFDEVILVYVPKGSPLTFNGIDSLKGKTVGVIRGWSYGDDFDAAVKAGTIKAEETASDALNFGKLSNGRLDAVLAIRESGAAALASAGLTQQVVALEPPLSSAPSFLAFNKQAGKVELLAKVNAALATLHQDGSFDRIVSSIIGK